MVNLTRPVGKVMLLPEEDTTKKYILVELCTGITPYRGLICRLFSENTLTDKAYKREV